MTLTLAKCQKVLELERLARQQREDELKEEIKQLRAFHAEDVLHYNVAVEQRDDADQQRDQWRNEAERAWEQREKAERERDEALVLLRECRSFVAAFPGQTTTSLLARLDALLAKGGMA